MPLVAGTGIKFEVGDSNNKVVISQDVIIRGNGAPTTSTVGFVGQLYLDAENFDFYQCVNVTEEDGEYIYTWRIHDTHAELINIGQNQTSIDSFIYPTITKALATEI